MVRYKLLGPHLQLETVHHKLLEPIYSWKQYAINFYDTISSLK